MQGRGKRSVSAVARSVKAAVMRVGAPRGSPL